jgi:hypothetical protein
MGGGGWAREGEGGRGRTTGDEGIPASDGSELGSVCLLKYNTTEHMCALGSAVVGYLAEYTQQNISVPCQCFMMAMRRLRYLSCPQVSWLQELLIILVAGATDAGACSPCQSGTYLTGSGGYLCGVLIRALNYDAESCFQFLYEQDLIINIIAEGCSRLRYLLHLRRA